MAAPTFIFGADGLPKTPQEAARLRAIAQAMAPQGAPKNVGEGLTSLGNAIAYRMMMNKAAKGDAMGQNAASSAFSALMGSFGGGAAPASPSVSNATPAPSTPTGQPPVPGIQSQGGDMEAYRNAIASIESAGSGDYAAVGPTHPKMGRALGRYQVMEANIGPWSQEVLGRTVTPEEFMANPQLQDQIFDGKFKSYASKYGPEGAAQAWFGGPGGVGKIDRKDSLGTSIGEYGNKFSKAIGSVDAVNAMGAETGYVDPMVSAPNSRAPVAQALAKTQPLQPVQTAAGGGRQGIMAALMGGQPQTQDMPTDYFPAAPSAPGASGPSPQQIMQVLTNPYASPEQKAIAQSMYEQQMQANDPLRQMQLEKGRLELERMRNPQADIPDSVRALQLRAQEAGLTPGTKEYSEFMLSGGNKGITVDARQMGNIPPGYKADYDANGNVISLSPIPGSPADAEAKAAQEKKALGQNMQAGKADVVTQDIDRAIAVMESGTLPDTGAGALLSSIPGTDAKRLSGLLDTVKANVSFDTLNQMRQASPTGGALGSVTENELKLLQSAIGSLDQSQDAATLKDNLNRVWNMYQDTVHGPGNGPPRRPLSFDTQAPKADEAPPPAGMDKELWDVMTPEERALWK